MTKSFYQLRGMGILNGTHLRGNLPTGSVEAFGGSSGSAAVILWLAWKTLARES